MNMPNTFRDALSRIVDPDRYTIFFNLVSRTFGSQRRTPHGVRGLKCLA